MISRLSLLDLVTKLARRLGSKLLVVTSEAQHENVTWLIFILKYRVKFAPCNYLISFIHCTFPCRTKRCRQVTVQCMAVAIYETIVLGFLCIVALQVELCGISDFDLFVRTGQISHCFVRVLHNDGSKRTTHPRAIPTVWKKGPEKPCYARSRRKVRMNT